MEANLNSGFFEYIKWRGDLTFDKDPFNVIDNSILAELTYIPYDGFIEGLGNKKSRSLKTCYKKIFDQTKPKDMNLGVIVPNTICFLAEQIEKSERFRYIRVSNYVNEIDNEKEIQFSAITYELDENTLYIGFRGTDDSLIGWQENFNSIHCFPVPAQVRAAEYVNKIAEMYPEKKFYLGGHSKGGNLANYAAIYMKDEYKDRLINCFSNDGQGFIEHKVDQEKYLLVKDKIIKIIPENDVVGLLFKDYSGHRIIVKSTNKGIFQHDGFSWVVVGNHYDEVKTVKPTAIEMEKTIKNMIDELTIEERKELTKNFYDFINSLKKDTIVETMKDKLGLLRAARGINRKNTRLFVELIVKMSQFR